jgi:hypothetical protein
MRTLVLKIAAAAATFYAIAEHAQYAAIFAFLWGYVVAREEIRG